MLENQNERREALEKKGPERSMTLKTLKDLQGLSFRGECKLRQEAIKWIKEDKESLYHLHCVDPAWEIIDKWIKRFNITDEEIKT